MRGSSAVLIWRRVYATAYYALFLYLFFNYCCTLLRSSVVHDAVLGISLSMMKLGNGTTMQN